MMEYLRITKLVLILLTLNSLAWSAEVNVIFKTNNFPLKVQLYSPTEAKAKTISETRIVTTSEALPVKNLLTKSIQIQPGESQALVMTINNTSKDDIYFFVAPHTMHPEHATAGFYFECLCNHSIYRIPAGKIWYRILRLNLAKLSTAKAFNVEHQIMGISKKDAKEKFSSRVFDAED